MQIALSDAEKHLDDHLPGLPNTKHQRQPQPRNLWHNLERLQIIPPRDTASNSGEEKERKGALQGAFANLRIADTPPDLNQGERPPSEHKPINQRRTGEPEALQIEAEPSKFTSLFGKEFQGSQGNLNPKDEDRPGEYAILAEAWPGKTSTGCVGLSSSLFTTFGGSSSVGKIALVYKVTHCLLSSSLRPYQFILTSLCHRLKSIVAKSRSKDFSA